MKLKIFKENLAEVNSYLLIKQKQAILIDPGFNGQAIIDYCMSNEVSIIHVVLTHGHFDHIKSIEVLAKTHKFNVYISKLDKSFLTNNEHNYANAFGSRFRMPDLDVIEISNNDSLNLLNEKFKITSTPGHTKGSVCIQYQKMLFTGDTLFYNSIGRTDLFSGNQSELFKSLEKIKKSFSNDIGIYPGHGENGKLKKIKEVNPYM